MKLEENNKEHLNDFIRLNEEWISKYFEIEDIDRQLAANPAKIFDDGGYVFSLLKKDKVVGVCALLNAGQGTYELARMAVASAHQGKGYGKKLMSAALSKLKQLKAKKVSLVSNTKLFAAIEMYKNHGFDVVTEGQHPVYSRANIIMERGMP